MNVHAPSQTKTFEFWLKLVKIDWQNTVWQIELNRHGIHTAMFVCLSLEPPDYMFAHDMTKKPCMRRYTPEAELFMDMRKTSDPTGMSCVTTGGKEVMVRRMFTTPQDVKYWIISWCNLHLKRNVKTHLRQKLICYNILFIVELLAKFSIFYVKSSLIWRPNLHGGVAYTSDYIRLFCKFML